MGRKAPRAGSSSWPCSQGHDASAGSTDAAGPSGHAPRGSEHASHRRGLGRCPGEGNRQEGCVFPKQVCLGWGDGAEGGSEAA